MKFSVDFILRILRQVEALNQDYHNSILDAPGTDGPVAEEETVVQLIKMDGDGSTATLISDVSKLVGLPMNKSPKSDTKTETD